MVRPSDFPIDLEHSESFCSLDTDVLNRCDPQESLITAHCGCNNSASFYPTDDLPIPVSIADIKINQYEVTMYSMLGNCFPTVMSIIN